MPKYFYNNAGNNDWSDDDNWSTTDEANSGPDSPPSPGDEVYIRQSCLYFVPQQLDFITTISSGAQLAIASNTTMDSSYSVTIESGGELSISGASTFEFSGAITVKNAGTLNVNDASIFNATYASVAGTLNLNVGSLFNISGTSTYAYFRQFGTLEGNVNASNNSILYVTSNTIGGSLTIDGATVYIDSTTCNATISMLNSANMNFINSCFIAKSFTITVGSSVAFENVVTINASQTVTNNGYLNISSGCILQGNGLINNTTCISTGELAVSIFTNNGTFTGFGGSTLSSSYITNNGNINLEGDAYLKLLGFQGFTNNGAFTHGTYTTRFKGKVFPQVPSSASWGNALL